MFPYLGLLASKSRLSLGLCPVWCFQVLGFFGSGLYEVQRKPRELTTVSSLGFQSCWVVFYSYLAQRSYVCFTYGVQGFFT